MEIHVHQKDGYAIVKMDNPPVNALSDEMKTELYRALESLKSNNKVLILTGSGTRTFAAGADLKELVKLDEESGKQRVIKSKTLFSYVDNYPIPIIAAINATTLGAGFELALCCDICIAAKEVKFGLPEIGLGIIPGGGGTQRLTRIISPGNAKMMIYTGKTVTADEALNLGIVQKIVNLEDLIDEAEKLAKNIARKAPLAVQSSKIAINQGLKTGLEEGLEKEGELFARLCSSKDKEEGIRAFLEKRTPVFKGE